MTKHKKFSFEKKGIKYMSNALMYQKLIYRKAYVDRIIHNLFLLFLFFLHYIIGFLIVITFIL